MNTLVITNQTATRMVVIASRTNSELLAGAKAMMIQELKNKSTTVLHTFSTPRRTVRLERHGEQQILPLQQSTLMAGDAAERCTLQQPTLTLRSLPGEASVGRTL